MSARKTAERVSGHIRTNTLRLCLWVNASIGSDSLYRSGFLPDRDTLPEPIDIGDHFGNVPQSILFGGIGTLAACAVLRLSAAPSTVRRTAFAAAATVGMLANAVAETKFGQQLFHIAEFGRNGYVPDQNLLDFAYGTVAATAAGVMVVDSRPPVPEGACYTPPRNSNP